jgi:glycosyltransferase A (GT-A) superfamily protein (DUF2064 family)
MGVMAKTPEPRRSKTRLCPPLLPEHAAALSAGFLRDTIENIRIAARSAPITSYAAYAPWGTEQKLRSIVGAETKLLLADGRLPMPEGVEGFGGCLLQAIQGMLVEGHTAACVLSSDSPSLPSRLLSEAAAILLAPGDRAVMGATRDGGYYLLGLKAPHAHMFKNIAWSTSTVADATRARAREMGLELVDLEVWYDIDDPLSLFSLLRDRNGYSAPRTHEVVDRLGLRHLPEFLDALGALE